jgi:hypothetical protein
MWRVGSLLLQVRSLQLLLLLLLLLVPDAFQAREGG